MTKRRAVLLGVVGCLGIVVVWALVVGYMSLRAARELSDAATSVRDVQAAALGGNPAQAAGALTRAAASSEAAHANLSSPLVTPVTWLPIVGQTVTAARTLAAASVALTTQALPDLVKGAELLDPKHLRTGVASIDVQRVMSAEPYVQQGAVKVQRVNHVVSAIDASAVLPQVRNRVIDAQRVLTQASSTLDRLNQAMGDLPDLLGAHGTRRYFVALLSPAESRGTGGLIGQYAVIRASNGRITIERLGSDADLGMMLASPLHMGQNYDDIYGQDMRYWVNMNQSPDMRPAARMWLKAWQVQFHQRLDGVISLDPVAVGHVIDAVGASITLPDGRTFTTGQQFADYAMNGIYLHYGDAGNSTIRKTEQLTIARLVMDRLLAATSDPRAFLRGLGQGVQERRVLLYSTHPKDDALFRLLGADGVLDTRPGGYAFAVVNNGAGNKIDYYLERTLHYTMNGCSGTRQRATVTFSMLNNVPTDVPLPFYVIGNLNADGHTPPRSGFLIVRIYLPEGTTITRAVSGGVVDSNEVDNEAGRPFYWTTATTEAGKPYVVRLDITYPADKRPVRIVSQPLARPQESAVSGSRCTAAK